MAKKLKSEVRYSAGMERTHCGNCIHFRERIMGLGDCTEVVGIINYSAWCELWKRKGPYGTRRKGSQ